jgi:recombinational DNA repair protein RecT|tara:strand:+ start:2853 stop:3143 length:291 start_codon:yes stop_codon:yes gene_type:complete
MKGYIRFTNGIVSVEEMQAFTWRPLDEDDPLMDRFRNREHDHIEKFFSILIFLRGGQKFMTATTKNNLNDMIKRFKHKNKGEQYEYNNENMGAESP